MKQIILLMITFFVNFSYSQIKKEVDNGVFITFPSSPEFKLGDNFRSYSTANNNAVFMVLVAGPSPDYTQYLKNVHKLSFDEKEQIKESTLDSFIRGFLGQTVSKGKIDNILVGNYSGKKVKYSAIHPTLGERTNREMLVLYIKGKIICLNVFYNEISPSQISKNQVDNFFNSITINQNL